MSCVRIFALLVVTVCGVLPAPYCPCSELAWCDPVRSNNSTEVFVFSVHNDKSMWSNYDWNRVTTVATVSYVSVDLMCLAHQHNVRVVLLTDFPGNQLTNATKRSEWIIQQLMTVQQNFYDGINIDFEEAIPKSRSDLRDGLTQLVNETFKMFKESSPDYQVTMDVSVSAICGSRCYDYPKLSTVVDFFFIMAYDEWWGRTAGPNCGYNKTLAGIKTYLAITNPSKVLLGVPWYGYKYNCTSLEKNVCTLGAGTRQLRFVDIYNIKYAVGAEKLWDNASLSPYFSYKDPQNNATYQIWYDDPESLTYKVQMAAMLNLRGVGIWQADDVNYNNTKVDYAVRSWMWDSLPLRPLPHQ